MRRAVSILLAAALVLLGTVGAAALPESRLFGDADQNGYVDVSDATLIQQALARYVDWFDDDVLLITDVDGDGDTNITDVTCIQRRLAHMADNFQADELVVAEDHFSITTDIPSGQCIVGTAVNFIITEDEEVADTVTYDVSINGEVKATNLKMTRFNITFTDPAVYVITFTAHIATGETADLKIAYKVVTQDMLDHNYTVDELIAQTYELLSNVRYQSGVGALTFDSRLTQIAKIKSQDIIDNGYEGHISPVLGTPDEMLEAYGVSYSRMGENIAINAYTPEIAFNTWMNSPKHKANMLDENFTRVGIGYVEDSGVWVMLLIRDAYTVN